MFWFDYKSILVRWLENNKLTERASVCCQNQERNVTKTGSLKTNRVNFLNLVGKTTIT